ncbi:MAG: aminodeoxychorismate synthase component I [Actinobacteria bacterium]|nr:aminodeoxychorismate synthase component I [Actinomycetota bacterium]
MKTLLIDNHDSFTYNLAQLLAQVNGEQPHVVRNDEASWEQIARLPFDNVVLSPGPGRPERTRDFGVCAQAIAAAEVPLLGVCLGHQGIGWLHGARVVHAPEPMHGRISAVLHDDAPLFAGIPREFQAVRYHSLCVEQPLPDALRPLAWTSDGVLMALAHRTRPLWGVQFHPESVCAEHGRRLLENFRDLTAAHGGRGRPATARAPRSPAPPPQPAAAAEPRLRLLHERIDAPVDAERAFAHLYGGHPQAFWLDSSLRDERARFSFAGATGGPLSALVTYDVEAGRVRVERDGAVETHGESIFDHLARELRRLRTPAGADELPFAFDAGFVGYLGYECKADCGGAAAHVSPLPDAAFVLADRLLAFDNRERATYAVCLVADEPDAVAEGARWLRETRAQLLALPPLGPPDAAPAGEPARFALRRPRERYLEQIADCKRHLADGETYELCLTNAIDADAGEDPLTLYRRLRRVNPAPFSAYLRFGDVAVLSSSPERFVSVGRDRWAEAKPIKGTTPRGATPAQDAQLAEALRTSEKTRAENLMIADLLRNDLGSVCETGTVHVPDLMHVERYETLHQLVTTVRGLLREGLDAADCVRACFPPGSMTGAPKQRTMELIDALEGEARGVYAGAIGYFGLGGGCDLSVVIRTIVLDGAHATIGVGGAIVTQSDADDEFEEIVLKGLAPLRAIDERVDARAALAGATVRLSAP